jgi:chromosome segregation and condensation protein ScpB
VAAAAAVVLAAGAAVAARGAELRRDASGWSLRVGSPSADLAARLQEQDARHRAEMEELRASLVSAPAAGADAAVLAAARELVERSEERQQARLEDALGRLSDRYEAQRRYDLAQVSAGMSYLEGKASLHAARTTELVGQVLLASQEK